ncbi:MAG: hypothetical protein AB7S48_05955 [Bacteroidales bacterium]
MTSQNDHYLGLLKLILPEELFDYFELINFEVRDNQVHVYLEELELKPSGYEKEKLISKGFHGPVTIQDFPLRDKPMYLHVRRRRWLVESTGEVIGRDWDTVAKGTRMTKGFAAFLKGLFGRLPDQ